MLCLLQCVFSRTPPWTPWTRRYMLSKVVNSVHRYWRGAWKLMQRTCRPRNSAGWDLLVLLLPLLLTAMGTLGLLILTDDMARQCPVHVARLRLMAAVMHAFALSCDVRAELPQPLMQLAQAVVLQREWDLKAHQAESMVERVAGTGSSSEDEYMDVRLEAAESEEEEAAEPEARPSAAMRTSGGTESSTSGHRPVVTEERIVFDRLGQRVREPPGPPPSSTRVAPAADAEASDDGSEGQLVSSGSSVELPPGAPPRGPPPPVPIQYTEAVALRLASAVGQAIPITTGRALVLVPSNWETSLRTQGVTLTRRAMTPGEQYHPHAVLFADDPPVHPAGPEGPRVPGPDEGRTRNDPARRSETENQATATTEETTGEERRQALKRAWDNPSDRARMTEAEVEEFLLDLDYDQLLSTLEEPPEDTAAGGPRVAERTPDPALPSPTAPATVAHFPTTASSPALSTVPTTSGSGSTGSTTGMASGSAGGTIRNQPELPANNNNKSRPHLLGQQSFASRVENGGVAHSNSRDSTSCPGATAEMSRSEQEPVSGPKMVVQQVAEPRTVHQGSRPQILDSEAQASTGLRDTNNMLPCKDAEIHCCDPMEKKQCIAREIPCTCKRTRTCEPCSLTWPARYNPSRWLWPSSVSLFPQYCMHFVAVFEHIMAILLRLLVLVAFPNVSKVGMHRVQRRAKCRLRKGNDFNPQLPGTNPPARPRAAHLRSRLGPKSQGHCHTSLRFWIGIVTCFYMIQPVTTTAVSDARVGFFEHRENPEARYIASLVHTEAKHGVHSNRAVHTITPRTSIRKRALKRAIRRASDREDQSTWYRGKRMTLKELTQRNRNTHLNVGVTSEPLRRQSRRLHIITWNAGGLTSTRYQEILQWLEQEYSRGHVIDMMIIQET